jgi:hypothetical protein
MQERNLYEIITAVRSKLYNCEMIVKLKYDFYALSNIMMEDEMAGQVARTENIGMSSHIMSKTLKARCTTAGLGVNGNQVLILGGQSGVN